MSNSFHVLSLRIEVNERWDHIISSKIPGEEYKIQHVEHMINGISTLEVSKIVYSAHFSAKRFF